MKVVIRILVSLCFLYSVNVHAQKGLYLGFATNVTSSSVLNQNTYGVKWHLGNDRNFELAYAPTIGYGGSFKVGYNFKEQLGLEWQAGYQAGGMNYKDKDQNKVIHRKSISTDYVTIGMAFRYTSIFRKNHYKQEQKVRLAVVVGPQIGILTRAALEYSLEATLIDLAFNDAELMYPNEFAIYNEAFYTQPISDDKDLFKSIEAGVLVQVGIDIYPKKWFYISPVATTYFGITDINADAFTKHSGYGASRHFNFGLNLSMGFYINQ